MDVLFSSAVLVEIVDGCVEDNEDGSEDGYGNPGSLSTVPEESSRQDCGGSSCDLADKSEKRPYNSESH